MRRVPVKRVKDSKIFKHTAVKTNQINVGAVQPRGGVRL